MSVGILQGTYKTQSVKTYVVVNELQVSYFKILLHFTDFIQGDKENVYQL